MTEETLKNVIETLLMDAMYAARDAAAAGVEMTNPVEGVEEIASIVDFERALVMSRDQGLFVRTVDGAELQVTILRRH